MKGIDKDIRERSTFIMKQFIKNKDRKKSCNATIGKQLLLSLGNAGKVR